MQTIPAGARFDLTDEQWALLAPLLPTGKKSGRPPIWPKRALIDGIRWRVRVGAPWRDVPERYGPWRSVYWLFRAWQRAGVWALVVTALQARADAAGLITWQVSVDSTIVRAHQHAAGARRDGNIQRERPGGWLPEPADHALGRSRGGLGTKLHLSCEQGRRLMSLVPRAGNAGTVHCSRPCSRASVCPVSVPGVRVPAPSGCWPTRRTHPRPIGSCWRAAGSRRRSRSRRTRPPTGDGAARAVDASTPSTRRSTSSGTRSNAGSTSSNATVL